MALEKWYRIKESPSKPTTKCEDTGVFRLKYEFKLAAFMIHIYKDEPNLNLIDIFRDRKSATNYIYLPS